MIAEGARRRPGHAWAHRGGRAPGDIDPIKPTKIRFVSGPAEDAQRQDRAADPAEGGRGELDKLGDTSTLLDEGGGRRSGGAPVRT